ncbi:MAG: DUF5652 family protein [Patescibacteria group bacterium]|mgnify:CR=1 FL=1
MLTNAVPLEQLAIYLGLDAWMVVVLIVVLALWSVVWKGWAMWLAARRTEKVWFILLLIINTAGILEIIYIFLIAKRNDLQKLSS